MAVELRWTCALLQDLAPRVLYQALALRSQVFVLEQNCVFLDPDGVDLQDGVWHLLGHGSDGELMAYARLLAPLSKGVMQARPMISRVVTAPSARWLGLGRLLMVKAIEECEDRWPGAAIDINAQAHLQAFYERLGFVITSEPYDEDGILHVDMKREARRP
jgi:ElaA protein